MKLVHTAAENHLSTVDPVIGQLIEQWGPCTIKPHTNYYHALVSSIISQQLSVKAADTIEGRFMDLYGGTLPSPEQIVATDPEKMRSAGLSGAKTRYIADLAGRILDGSLEIERISTLSNQEVVSELTAVKGIGEWTAHMFLMFCLGRLDVLPVGDLGIKMGIKKLYHLDHVPSPAEVIETSAVRGWHPYESIACWYIWRSLENKD